jgi:hypothetical protein
MKYYLGYLAYVGTTTTEGAILSREHSEEDFRKRAVDLMGPFYGSKIEVIEAPWPPISSHPISRIVPDYVMAEIATREGHYTWYTITHKG